MLARQAKNVWSYLLGVEFLSQDSQWSIRASKRLGCWHAIEGVAWSVTYSFLCYTVAQTSGGAQGRLAESNGAGR
ncbi:UNVERIFIED_CONTAM: hypothetical protein Sangu_3216700 [Sesamum angustifolium]|uniref:Uncharacterized protein n=1 Tax=Sesamum angustifolium TaxID=2727405 RepID=A0AAW2JIW5_9LAMI